MVHKKYIKKGDKLFGPYYYENKREGGKVVTRYVGRDVKSKNHFFGFLFLLFLLLFLIVFFMADNLSPTGRISFNVIGGIYEPGELIGGKLEFSISPGELIPEDSVIMFEYGSKKREILFSSVVSSEISEGKYYAEGVELEGEGKGYGLSGKREFPEIEFELIIKEEFDDFDFESDLEKGVNVGSSEAVPDVPAVPDPVSKGGGGSGSSSSTEPVPESEPAAPEAVESPITGEAIKEEKIKGSVSKDESFQYRVSGDFEIININIDGEEVSEDYLQADYNNGELVVYANYPFEEEGFGEEYFNKKGEMKLSVDLADLNLVAEKGINSIDVFLIYSDKILASANKEILVKGEEDEILETEGVIELSPESYTVEVVQHRAVIGQPVKWSKRINLNENPSEKVIVDFSDDVENVRITEVVKKKSSEVNSKVISIREDGEEVEIVEAVENSLVTGEVTAEIKLNKDSDILNNIVIFLRELLNYRTGNVVSEAQAEEGEVVEEVVFEYYTEAPYSVEKENENSKEVLIVGPENFHYTEILAYSEIPERFEIVKETSVSIYWKESDVYISPEVVLDLDGNGIYDYVEWIVPHLSNQTFIIEITNAEHLNANRSIIANIYPEVKDLDDVWSPAINSGEYVRVSFEQNLTFDRDITVYPRTVSGNPRIEIYEIDGAEIIAQFNSLNDNEYNKVFLDGLQGSQDRFDLKILDGSVEFDHIIDPEGDGDDPNPPSISFVPPTPSDQSTPSGSSIYVNLSSSDESAHYAFVDFYRDLLLWIRMDDVSSGNPLDLSSYGFDGIKQGDANQSTGGKFGEAFSFNGTGDYISIGSGLISNFNKSYPFTVTAWVKTNDSSTSRQIVSDSTIGGVGWALYYDSSTNKITFEISDGTVSADCDMIGTITDNQWHFVYGRYSGGSVSCGLNGVDSLAIATYTGGGFINNVGLSIGSLNSASSIRAWNGSIDEVLIFNRSLSNSNLDSLYDATTQFSNNYTSLSQSIPYNFTGYAVDAFGNLNNTEIREVTLLTLGPTDSDPPEVTINLPQNITYLYSNLPLVFNVTLNEAGSVNYSLNGVANISMSSSDGNFISSNGTLSSGSYIFKVHAEDSSGNKNYTESITFYLNKSLINSCIELSDSGDYFVTANIIPTTGACVNVTAENVTLYGQGFTIGSSDFTDNVIYSDKIRTKIVDLNIVRSSSLSANAGIYLLNANHSNISNINFTGNTGIVLQKTSHSDFSDNLFNNSDRGVSTLSLGDNNTYLGNNFIDSNYGIILEGNNSYFNYNTVTGSVVAGVYITGHNNILLNNTFSEGKDSIYLYYGNNNLFANSTIQGSTENAIVFVSGEDNTIQNMSISGTASSYYDIDFGSSNRTLVKDSFAEDYKFESLGGILKYYLTGFGEVIFLDSVNGSGENLSAAIDISINLVTTTDDEGLNQSANITFFNMPGGFSDPYIIKDNKTICEDCYNFTSLNAEIVRFNVTEFAGYHIGDVAGCLGLSCVEGDDCVINSICKLSSDLCTDGICNFRDFNLSASVYTFYNDSGDGKNLDLNLTGNLNLLSDNKISFKGKKGEYGGNAGVLNITLSSTALFNRTLSNFDGKGGDGVLYAGGKGGILEVYYHGLIGGSTSWNANISGGKGGTIITTPGAEGNIKLRKNLVCPLDPDVNNDGRIAFADTVLITRAYNNISIDPGFNAYTDMDCNDKVNVIELSKIGFSYGRGS